MEALDARNAALRAALDEEPISYSMLTGRTPNSVFAVVRLWRVGVPTRADSYLLGRICPEQQEAPKYLDTGNSHGQFSKVASEEMGPDPGIFELSKGMLKWK